jgi:hypothetical protein
MAKDSIDNETLRKYILAGLLLGGGTAFATTLARTRKLNKKLQDYENLEPRSDEHTIVVPVSGNKLAMDKSAEVSDVYKVTALAGAGVLSYAALSALYRRIEDNRMKEVENAAYNKAVSKLVGENSEKTAQASWALSNIDQIRNVAALLALIGSAAWMKKKLDRENVDSEKLKPVKSDTILFQDAQAGDSKQASAFTNPVTGTDLGEEQTFSNKLRKFLGKTPESVLDGPAQDSVLKIRRILNENPEAAKALTSNVLDASGHGKWNLLQNVPIAGNLLRNYTLKQLGLGSSYRAGWDPQSEENSFRPPKKLAPGMKEEDLVNQGVSQVRQEILNNKKLRDHMVKLVADKGGLSGWTQAYLRHRPGVLLDRMGITVAPATYVRPEKTASVKNSVANSYFA